MEPIDQIQQESLESPATGSELLVAGAGFYQRMNGKCFRESAHHKFRFRPLRGSHAKGYLRDLLHRLVICLEGTRLFGSPA